MHVNGHLIQTYTLDTVYTFKDRLAHVLQTLPEYLQFPIVPSGASDQEEYNILLAGSRDKHLVAVDLLAEIRDSAANNRSIVDLLKLTKGLEGDPREKVIYTWFVYNTALASAYAKQGVFALEKMAKSLVREKMYIVTDEITREYDVVTKRRKRRIRSSTMALNDRVIAEDAYLEQFDNIVDPTVYTPFDVEFIVFSMLLDLDEKSILELFDTLILTPEVPFATTRQFYKILSDVSPPDEWTRVSGGEDSIVLQVLQRRYNTLTYNADHYSQAVLKGNKASIVVSTAKGNVSRDEFTNRALSTINGKHGIPTVLSTEETMVVGLYYYPGITLDVNVFKDLVLNDPLFSSLIKVDDHERATKKKKGVYVVFFHPSIGSVTAAVSEKMMTRVDPTLKGLDPDFFPLGSEFIRVRISKATNMVAARTFQDIMARLLVLYDNKYNSIVAEYRRYIPTFGFIQAEEALVPPPEKHADKVPDLFVAGYTRNCKPDRMPTIITDAEVPEASNRVMKFPRDVPDDPDAFKFPMDGEKQKYYTCKGKVYKHIGLKENNLTNADRYPLVPCCYRTDRSKTAKWENYFNGKEIVAKESNSSQYSLIITNKILKPDQFGTLPDTINSLLGVMYPDPGFAYARKGVFRNVNSLLEVVMVAMDDQTDILSIESQADRELLLKSERTRLANSNLLSTCRQEQYDKSPDFIKQELLSTTEYLSPSKYIHLLEEAYDCNIYIFSKKGSSGGGEMILPRHTQSYYRTRQRRHAVYVYEHMGSESDRAKYPQCELIIRHDLSTREAQYVFTHTESRAVRTMYDVLRRSYALDRVIAETAMPMILPSPTDGVKIVTQVIDSYGKTRQINITFRGIPITLLTSPIQPISAPETTSESAVTVHHQTVIEFAAFVNMHIESQTVSGGTAYEISGTIGNVIVKIPIISTHPLPGFDERSYGMSARVDDSTESVIDTYSYNKRMARYLTEYALWAFSRYLKKGDVAVISETVMAAFSRDGFAVDANHVYGTVGKRFSRKGTVMKDGRLVVQSVEMQKRLLYVLRMSVARNVAALRSYHSQKYIKNYYENVTDFRIVPGQVLLYGDNAVEKWISEAGRKYTVTDSVLLGTRRPYFFKNPLVYTGAMFVAQNISSMEKAVYIADTWSAEGYNCGNDASSANPGEFDLYAYRNSTDIAHIHVKGDKGPSTPVVLGYKVSNEPHYTVLLPL